MSERMHGQRRTWEVMASDQRGCYYIERHACRVPRMILQIKSPIIGFDFRTAYVLLGLLKAQ